MSNISSLRKNDFIEPSSYHVVETYSYPLPYSIQRIDNCNKKEINNCELNTYYIKLNTIPNISEIKDMLSRFELTFMEGWSYKFLYGVNIYILYRNIVKRWNIRIHVPCYAYKYKKISQVSIIKPYYMYVNTLHYVHDIYEYYEELRDILENNDYDVFEFDENCERSYLGETNYQDMCEDPKEC